ncbi:homeobox domain-containing protein [Chlamydoabsidia padenii]|nr:homeobox domain-containing protein [Chlamydoabsidia padenii]
MATVIPNNNNNREEPVRKRTRATAEQLAVLEDMFAVNVSPNSKVRKQLADQLKMTDRSIQIWFQNRRAKVKHMQKRAQLQMHQANMRAQLYHYQQQHYYLQQQYAPHQRAHSLDSYNHHRSTTNSTTTTTTTTTSNGFMDQQQRQSVPPSLFSYADIIDSNPDNWSPASTTIDPTHLIAGSPNLGLSITSLTIGRWHRLKMQPKDLTCAYQPDHKVLCWHIVDGQHHFKMEIPVANIQQLTYTSLVEQDGLMGELLLDLLQPPLFYMKHQQDWISCIDFTEHRQASQVLQHTLKGIGMTLWQELTTIMTSCPETQRWIKMTSSPTSSNSSVASDGMTDLFSTNISMDDYQQLSTQISSSSTGYNLSASLTGSTLPKCDDPFTTQDDFLIDPFLLDPSLWTSNGFIIS